MRAFLRAAKRGYEFAAQNPADAAGILCEQVPELDRELIAKAQASISPEYISDASAWGEIDPARWRVFFEWLNEKDLVENKIEADGGYDLGYLEG